MTTTNDAPAPAPSGSGVRVKPLEWHKPNDGGTLSRADTIIGIARVWTHHEANGAWFWSIENHASGQEANETDAKKMLWATYEHRILSALASDASPRGEAAAWRVRPIGDKSWHLSHEPPRMGYEGEPLYAHPAPATVEMREALRMAQKAIRELREQGAPTAYWDDVEAAITAALAPETEGRKG